ncbi:MAG: penicillin-binding transpeptidase domain-containing protein [Pirellulales bacterium]
MHDWHAIIDEQAAPTVAVSRDRVRWLLAAFALVLAAIFFRAVQLEVSDGANFRRLAARPIERDVTLAPQRGRILARDGSVLAAEGRATALAVKYRYLQQPPDAAWLRSRARLRLPARERRDPTRLAHAEEQVRAELAAMHRRLAQLCDVAPARWHAKVQSIDQRVSALAKLVNERRRARFAERSAVETPHAPSGLASVLTGLFAPPDALAPPPVIVVEETAFHRIVDEVPPAVATEIQQHPELYPGVQVVEHRRRDYPQGSLAAHAIGYVGRSTGLASQVVSPESGQDAAMVSGLMGIERLCEPQLGGQPGVAVQSLDRRGRVLAGVVRSPPIAGRDVVLTIDPPLQRAAEMWLDHHLRRQRRDEDASAGAAPGGAVVVIDVHSGELLAVASAPRFDPNQFATGDPRVEHVLADPAQPLFDRTAKMALPPGSVFKSLTALALVSEKAIDPLDTFHCRGYLDDPQRLRCQLYREQQIGHGDVTLADALAQSCNVYFFEHVNRIGGVRLVDWAARLGFGDPTGAALLEEASGALPTREALSARHQTPMFAVGQGALTATPVQVARFYAAIANGGYLITPSIARERVASERAAHRRPRQPSESLKVRGLTDEALAAVRAGLRRVVDDPNGTAFATVHIPGLAIAGKTGTAETGGQQEDHAWFAGYAPADEPRYAFVVVLQHAGHGGEAAGPLARNLIERMQELGYFGPRETADKSFPPGKG